MRSRSCVILKPITDFSPTVGKYSGAIAQGLPMSIENYLKEVRSPILFGAIALRFSQMAKLLVHKKQANDPTGAYFL